MSDRATISREELRSKIERGDKFLLFEVLPEMYYRKHHLPGAVLMVPTDVEGTVQRYAVDAADEIVIYCWDDH